MNFPSRSLARARSASGLGLAVFTASLLAGSAAYARTEVLRWTHSRPADVQRWEARVGLNSGGNDQILTLANPTVDAQGVYQSSITVADDVTVYIALVAVSNQGEVSPRSGEQRRAPADSGGGGGGETPLGAGQTIPPSPNSLVRRDFSTNAPGTAVSGWVDTGASYATAVNDGLFGVVDVGGNRTLATASTANDIHSHLSPPPSSFSNSTFSGRLALTSAAGSAGVTSYSQLPTQARYYRLGSTAGGAFTIAGLPTLSCPNPSTGVVPQVNAWYVFELTVTSESSQNRIQAKVWRQGDSEPTGPQAECLDTSSSRSTNGTIGVWSGGEGQKYWDDLEVTPLTPTGPTTLAPPILIQIVPVTP